VQVDSVNTRVKSAPGVCHQRLHLKYDEPLQNFAFHLNLRRYNTVPYNQHNVGVLNTATGEFTTIATTGDAASGKAKYNGAAVVGNKVYFTPRTQNNVGVLDTTTVGRCWLTLSNPS